MTRRSEQAPERVEVMAEDAGSILRQAIHQMRVGVIADVEEVEPVGERTEAMRVVKEAIE
jgi:hypothetical protein